MNEKNSVSSNNLFKMQRTRGLRNQELDGVLDLG